MITTNETAAELRAQGWVPLWRQPIEVLEAAGVPIKLAPDDTDPSGVMTAVPMAPRWAVELITDWPEPIDSALLNRVVRETYLHSNPEQFAGALLAAYSLDGSGGTRVLLDAADLERRIARSQR